MIKMAKEDGGARRERFADAFYRSHEWRRCRAAYARKMIWCERCARRGLTVPGEEVHHTIRLTPENITDPSVALNWENLELLCARCHDEEHAKRRYRADGGGHIDLPPV
jgi:5-methylcytosine-specific restriction endonuclease McrA